MNKNKQELIDGVWEADELGKNAKKLLTHILEFTDEHTLLLYLIKSISYAGTLNDELCEYCDMYDCFPPEDEEEDYDE